MSFHHRERIVLWLALIGIFLICAAVAPHLAPVLGVSYTVAYLVALIAASALLSVLLWFSGRRLRRSLEAMPESERLALAVNSPDIRYAIITGRAISPHVVTTVGAVAINGMVVPLFVGPLAFLQYVLGVHDPVLSALSLAAGFVIAWSWWSIGVTIWRSWAMRTGMSKNEVQWRGERASILWPQGHFFERTEFGNLFFRPKDE